MCAGPELGVSWTFLVALNFHNEIDHSVVGHSIAVVPTPDHRHRRLAVASGRLRHVSSSLGACAGAQPRDVVSGAEALLPHVCRLHRCTAVRDAPYLSWGPDLQRVRRHHALAIVRGGTPNHMGTIAHQSTAFVLAPQSDEARLRCRCKPSTS